MCMGSTRRIRGSRTSGMPTEPFSKTKNPQEYYFSIKNLWVMQSRYILSSTLLEARLPRTSKELCSPKTSSESTSFNGWL
jgi:hypothetical protein